MRYRALVLAVLLTLAACGGGDKGGSGHGKGGHGSPGGGRGGDGPEQQVDERVLVDAAAVGPGSVADHLQTTGIVESLAQADIVPEASGVVQQILVEVGDPVSKGQTLAVLANPSLEAGESRAEVELERARAELHRAEALHGKGAISDKELADARQALRTAEASFGEASRTRGFTRLTSPITGVVSARDVRLGEVAGGKRAFQVVDLSRLRVVVQLPEKDLPRIHEGQIAVLEGAYDGDARVTAEVTRISPVVDATSGTVQVQVGIDPGQTALRPGQFAKVRVEVARHDGVLTMPRRALVWEDGDPIAWRVIDAPPPEPEEGEEGEEADEEGGGIGEFLAGLFEDDESDEGTDGKDGEEVADLGPKRVVEKVQLVVGFVDPDLVEVSEGLAQGDLVVTVGNENLREETRVRLPDDPVPEPAAASADDEDE